MYFASANHHRRPKKVRKPDPEAFVSALRKLDGHPAAAISVGDRFHLDIQPALDARFQRGFWLTRQASHQDPRISCVQSLMDIAPLI